ncbi:RNA pseudouridine synthase [Sneathiella sp. P13V-1]|uniref:pseudouridine synthase n=1 Tax=Sneathiella sp. P13V-1 TaxID=2697366 RepID=UPI00187B723B|nr:pseudouridine synthase [Sneathiella sp. P13V-1]MBE7637707.1 RNA pseudouridine synthase [Sneathiella sp. P13V-1]
MNPYNPPKTPNLEIFYKDQAILLAIKPSGLLTVPGREAHKKDCLINRITPHFPTATIVHRLDLETSGLVVIALNKVSQSSLGRSFQQRKVEKRYLAWVDGNPINDGGTIDIPLFPDWPNRPLQKIDYENGKAALTHWKVLERREDRALVMLMPVTGRSHQLRVHMKALGHTILGDPLYADERVRGMADRLMLHAGYLAFPHPDTDEMISFSLPPATKPAAEANANIGNFFATEW